MIHPTALIHPQARVHPSVAAGPYAVVDSDVEVAEGCIIGPHVYLTGMTTIGPKNHFFAGCVIGEAPQDLKYDGQKSRVRIGSNNVFREHVTVHRAASSADDTVIGSGNFLMQNSHVGHNVKMGDHVILAGGAMLAGHARVQDRAFISGNCLVHQFVRIGTLSMMQGGAAISKDLPPFTMARGYNGICGLNTVGLRRAGMNPAERLQLKKLYRMLFREGGNIRQAVAAAQKIFTNGPAAEMLSFLVASQRGVCADRAAKRGGPAVSEACD